MKKTLLAVSLFIVPSVLVHEAVYNTYAVYATEEQVIQEAAEKKGESSVDATMKVGDYTLRYFFDKDLAGLPNVNIVDGDQEFAHLYNGASYGSSSRGLSFSNGGTEEPIELFPRQVNETPSAISKNGNVLEAKDEREIATKGLRNATVRLSPYRDFGILHEFEVTNTSDSPITGDFYRFADSYLETDQVPVYSLGPNKGMYIKGEKYRLDYHTDVPNGPDVYKSSGYSGSNEANFWRLEGSGDEGAERNAVLSKDEDTAMTFAWRNVTIQPGETKTFSYVVSLSGNLDAELIEPTSEVLPGSTTTFDITAYGDDSLSGITDGSVDLKVPSGLTITEVEVKDKSGSVIRRAGAVNTLQLSGDDIKDDGFTLTVHVKADDSLANQTASVEANVSLTASVGRRSRQVSGNVKVGEIPTTSVSLQFVSDEGATLQGAKTIADLTIGDSYDVTGEFPASLTHEGVVYDLDHVEGETSGTVTKDMPPIKGVYKARLAKGVTLKGVSKDGKVIYDGKEVIPDGGKQGAEVIDITPEAPIRDGDGLLWDHPTLDLTGLKLGLETLNLEAIYEPVLTDGVKVYHRFGEVDLKEPEVIGEGAQDGVKATIAPAEAIEKELEEGKPYMYKPVDEAKEVVYSKDGQLEVIFQYKPETVVEEKEEVKTEEVPYATEYVVDLTLKEGESKVLQEGVLGERTITEKVTFTNYEESAREVVSDEVTKEPVVERIAYGPGEIPFKTERTVSMDLKEGEECVTQKGEVGFSDGRHGDKVLKEPVTEKIEYGATRVPFETEYKADLELKPGEEKELTAGEDGFTDPEQDGKILKEVVNRVVAYGPEEIPFKEKVQDNPNLEAGVEKVIQEGQEGRKDRDGKVLVEPKDKIIERGVKKLVETGFESVAPLSGLLGLLGAGALFGKNRRRK